MTSVTKWLLLLLGGAVTVVVALLVLGPRTDPLPPSSARVAAEFDDWERFANLIHPPAASLLPASSPEERTASTQRGRLIGYTWLMDDAVAEATPCAPIDWPMPTAVTSRRMLLVIDEPAPPVRIGLSLKQRPEGGVGLDAIEWHCGQPGWEALGSSRPDCVIEQGRDGTTVSVPFELPLGSDEWFIAVDAVWLVPPDAPGAEQLPIREAWWVFALQIPA